MKYTPYIPSTIPSQQYFEIYGNTKDKNIEKKGLTNIKKEEPNTSRTKNILLGTLVALASLSMPALSAFDNSDTEKYSYNTVENTTAYEPNTTVAITKCNPKELAKGGKDDSVVELKELAELLNFESTKDLPIRQQTAIQSIAMAQLQFVNANDKDAEEKIIKQINNTQKWIDKTAYEYKINPPKTQDELNQEHDAKYITYDEVINNVDFSKLLKYQTDLTLVKAFIRNSMEKIERSDSKVSQKFDKQLEKSQALINNITAKYERNSKIAGNTNNDTNISKAEMIGLLNLESLNGLPEAEQERIFKEAVDQYVPVYFELRNEEDIKRTNQRLLEKVQPIQNYLDSQANSLKKEIFMNTYK